MENAVSFKGNICVSASMKMLKVTEAPGERCGNMWWSRYDGSVGKRSVVSCFIVGFFSAGLT